MVGPARQRLFNRFIRIRACAGFPASATSASYRFRTLHFRDTKITSSDYVVRLKSESMRHSIKPFFAVASGLSNQRGTARPLARGQFFSPNIFNLNSTR